MSTLNFKHLRYFWMVAKTGSIARAAEQLHLTPQSISGQLSEFSDTLGVELFRRVGRSLELTDTGRRILSHAEEIFSTGDELLEIVRDQSRTTTTTFRVGCADSVSKLIACRLVEPALRAFCYLPFEHSEDPEDQRRSIEMMRQLDAESLRYALLHADIIERFGRFPHRNAVLQRTSTAEEEAFLAQGGFAG